MVKGGKNKKKKNWKLRRQLRRTFGCLFLISAIIVGAIPVQSTQAAGSNGAEERDTRWVKAEPIPDAKDVIDGSSVFYTEDEKFRFAYSGEGTSKGAVIADIPEGKGEAKMTIPDKTDGYVKFTIRPEGGGTPQYVLVAADASGRPLYYKKPVPAPAKVESEIPFIDFEMENGGVVTDPETNQAVVAEGTADMQALDDEPAAVDAAPQAAEEYKLCLLSEKDIWLSLEGSSPVSGGLFYKDASNTYMESPRLKNVEVRYISGKDVTVILDSATERESWKVNGPATKNKGVFGDATTKNITSVTVGKNVLGIGDYAFAGSTSLTGISLGSQLNTIGNYAFQDCIRLTNATMPPETSVVTLGAFAFSGCAELTSFDVPTSTEAIGDFCFQNCGKLATVNFIAPTGTVTSSALNRIGYKAFLNCKTLKNLSFPSTFAGSEGPGNPGTAGNFHISTIQGCSNLAYIKAPNDGFNLVTDARKPDGTLGTGTIDGTYDFIKFREEMPDTFYVEGPGYSDSVGTKTNLHVTANREGIAFSYLEEQPTPGKFEIVKYAYKHNGTEDKTIPLIFAVNKANELITFEMPAGAEPEVIVLPEVIGPYGVSTINEGSFSDNCFVEKIVLPASLTTVNANAFKGCHNLKHLIFNDASEIVSIGTDAFATQVVTPAISNCAHDLGNTPYLSFSGSIENDEGKNTEPFKYAMKSTSNINTGTQLKTYITYYSGWPSNLTVMYNDVTGMSELIDYPTTADLEAKFSVTASSGGGTTGGGTTGGDTARSISLTGIGIGAGTVPPPATDPIHKNGYQYPYITKEQADAAEHAIDKYVAWKAGGAQPTELEVQIAESTVYNMVIPTGVNSIKTGLFSAVDSKNKLVTGMIKNTQIKSLTLKSVDTLEPYAFSKLENLETFNMLGGSTIGDYTFNDCNKLVNVEIGPSVMKLGLRPFKSCDVLNNVSFPNSATFACNESIIFGKAGDALTSIVECLETRGASSGRTTVGPEELKGIKKIEPEAFMNCDGIGEVDLSQSEIAVIPRWCFADYAVDPDKVSTSGPNGGLGKVVLPSTATSIDPGAFWNSRVYSVVIPSSVTYIEPNAFSYTNNGWDGTTTPTFEDANHRQITFICLDSSPAATYASKYPYINTKETDDLKAKYTVWFFDAVDQTNPTLIEKQQVIHGQDAKLPTPPVHEGYTFTQWYPANAELAVSRDNIEISAFYTKNGAVTHTVQFLDWDDKTLDTQVVEHGKDAKAPTEPTREGYVFTGWRPGFTNITDNLTVYAQYEKKDASKFVVSFYNHDGTLIGERQQVEPGKSAIEPAHPTREGYTFTGWQPADTWKNVTKDVDVYAVFEKGTSGGGDNGGGNNGNNGNNGSNGNNGNNNNDSNNNNNNNNSVSGNSTKYKVVVNGGSGSGDYTAGTIVNINAYATSDGKVFDKWTSSSFGVGFVNVNAISTTFTMPTNNVEITANFKTQSSVSSNTRNLQRNTATTVDVNKGGISDKDIASANVNGSSDNYIVKITEDAQATEAVIAALEAKYGDLGNIAYLPMDISLYDATGQYKITDLGGVTVDITLPLPDELRQYGGNNMAGSVVNGTLENLNPKFTVIDGVPCVQFTATHFSPYVIYVDKANLTAGAIDATPQTGDPIHPKWFLAIGLACIAVILFCKKDKSAQLKTV